MRAGIAHHLQIIDRCTRRREQRDDFGLGIKRVEFDRFALRPVARAPLAGEHQPKRGAFAVAQIAAAKFEQRDRGGAAILIALRRGEQSWQQRGAHHLHIFADRIGEAPCASAKAISLRLRQKAPINRFVEPARGGRPAQLAFDALERRRGGFGNAIGARQRRRRDMIEPDDTDDFLDQIGRTVDIAPPAWNADLPVIADAKAQRFENRLLAVGGNVDPTQPRAMACVIAKVARRDRRLTRADDFRSLAAANLEDQPRDHLDRVIEKRRINPALKPRPRIRGQRKRLSGLGDMFGREISDFEQHIARRFRTTRMFAAHDSGNVVHAGIIGDHGHRRRQLIVLAVERGNGFTFGRAARKYRAAELFEIIGMARAALIEHHIIGDVDERRDWALTRRLEPRLHPRGRRAVADALDDATIKGRATLWIIGADLGGAGEAGTHGGVLRAAQRAKPGRGKVARDPVDAHAILTIGRDRDVNHRIVEIGIIGKGGANHRIARQFDDAIMVIAKL